MFLQRTLPSVNGEIIEIGSKDYGNTASFRDFYKRNEYIGIDIEEGKGVDLVVDLSKGIGSLEEDKFSLGICCSVLEHSPQPWVVAENITKLIKPGGKLYISAPWVWRYHAYPDDYYRFSFKAIPYLFNQFVWGDAYYSTNVEGEFIKIELKKPTMDDEMAYFRTIENNQRRKYLPYLLVNMIGEKKFSGSNGK